jgi:hypothetical protein
VYFGQYLQFGIGFLESRGIHLSIQFAYRSGPRIKGCLSKVQGNREKKNHI